MENNEAIAFQCLVCKKIHKNKKKLNSCIQSHNLTLEKYAEMFMTENWVQCTICKKMFYRAYKRYSKNGEELINCSYKCGHVFSQRSRNKKDFLKTKMTNLGYSNEIVELYLKDALVFNDALIFKQNNVFTKLKCNCVCQQCGTKFVKGINEICYRKFFVELCKKCYWKKLMSSSEWKDTQSKVQKIAQARPETKRKNSESVSRFWENHPEVKLMLSKKMSNMYETDINYRKSVSGSIYKGHINTKFGTIRFESLLELFYILQIEKDQSIISIERWKTGIPYKFENKYRKYYPDFLINSDRIVEIKSCFYMTRDQDIIEAKANGAKIEYPQYRYSILLESHIECKKLKEIKDEDLQRIVFYNKKAIQKLEQIKNGKVKK